jgi:hypothetical protein
MRCNIEVDDLTSVMQQDYEAVQVAEGQCRNGEKVDGGNLLEGVRKFVYTKILTRSLLALHFSLILPKHRYAFYDFPAKFTDARAIHNSSVVVLWFLR